ncbi:MAG: NADH-quinone oxidoreductase subunit C/D [Myxococcales bacterium]|nr:NADH-quinone oxidoreductase subunit C/D [Myxococcales bacterium]USN50868.1 MAG: NADH-quinone oxidoreductase subunit C/D [Myxococcales bacterium]
MNEAIVSSLKNKFPEAIKGQQRSNDLIPTVWIEGSKIKTILSYLKNVPQPFSMLYDLTAIDETEREHCDAQPNSDVTLVYHLLSLARNEDIRLKVALKDSQLSVESVTELFKNANWYEREIFDMFGVSFIGHPHLMRLLMPRSWKGHPLRKVHPARATEMGLYHLDEDQEQAEQDLLEFKPEEWGLKRKDDDHEYIFLNLGPQHPGTHGVLRIILQLDGEEIVDSVLDIGFHHRGAEKMGERQNWHSYIPYTDRIDYLGGVMNNLAYLLAVEQLAGIDVPPKAQTIRVMMCELFRIASHLVWYGTFAQDIGSLSPIFYMFNEREKIFRIVEGITGGRMHPSWFRIGGVAHDLPQGWENAVLDFTKNFPSKLKEYDRLVMENSIFKARTIGIGAYSLSEAIEWGISGAGLRATGLEWDLRKKRPYSGYEQFNFDIPTAKNGDCYDRGLVRIEEMRQSLRIIEQCVKKMPNGPTKSNHPLTTPPNKAETLANIETMIQHFLNVSWGPVMPAGESFFGIEATKGINSYYLISDGSNRSYRTRIRTPSFAHLQMLPLLAKGTTIPDLMAILGSVDFVLADLDR